MWFILRVRQQEANESETDKETYVWIQIKNPWFAADDTEKQVTSEAHVGYIIRRQDATGPPCAEDVQYMSKCSLP